MLNGRVRGMFEKKEVTEWDEEDMIVVDYNIDLEKYVGEKLIITITTDNTILITGSGVEIEFPLARVVFENEHNPLS